jgi:hypothetical protein
MAVTLNALTTGVGGLQTTGDTSGQISLQSNGSTVLAVTASGVSVTGTLSSTSALPIASGGTNNGSLAVTAGGALYTDGTKVVNVGAGTSGQLLQSNGASAPSWVTFSSGGTDFLGSITTTSGTSQALTGLTLTNYKYLQIFFNNVSTNNSSSITSLNSTQIWQTIGNLAESAFGTSIIDLNAGWFSTTQAGATTNSGNLFAFSNNTVAGKLNLTTASTSLTFSNSVGSFDAGSIRVYGAK